MVNVLVVVFRTKQDYATKSRQLFKTGPTSSTKQNMKCRIR